MLVEIAFNKYLKWTFGARVLETEREKREKKKERGREIERERESKREIKSKSPFCNKIKMEKNPNCNYNKKINEIECIF